MSRVGERGVQVKWDNKARCYKSVDGQDVHMEYEPGVGFVFHPKQPEKPASAPLARAIIALLNMEPSTKGLPGDAISGPEGGEKQLPKTHSPADATVPATVSRQQPQLELKENTPRIPRSLLDQLQTRLREKKTTCSERVLESSSSPSDKNKPRGRQVLAEGEDPFDRHSNDRNY